MSPQAVIEGGVGWSLNQGRVRTVTVGMAGVDFQNGFQVALGEDQQPVDALAADA